MNSVNVDDEMFACNICKKTLEWYEIGFLQWTLNDDPVAWCNDCIGKHDEKWTPPN